MNPGDALECHSMNSCQLARPWFQFFVLALVWTVSLPLQASDYAGDRNGWNYGGHIKYQYVNTLVPDYSVFRRLGEDLQDHNLEARLKLSARRDRWDFKTDIQLISVHSDTLAASRNLPIDFFQGAGLINDDRRPSSELPE